MNGLRTEDHTRSDRVRKRDPRLLCSNFVEGLLLCSCPEFDQKLEEAELPKKKRIQVPGCISELKGYHRRHRVCLRCANASFVVLDGEDKLPARWIDYPSESRDLKHLYDQSLSTYKGHSVLRTLIRCYFSPAHSTGQKYIYTGSDDNYVYIYDLESGDKVAALKHNNSPVRDCNWHPHYPTLISSSWDGDLVKWEFPGSGEPPIMSKKRVRRRHF
ncbi:unnamed protein product [Eruca vesicaria subsp. sativa]|uniref:LEC14B protein n=1 Tax=Eruca vesicaria subsp. sativa TaxID=29727 RepID=A0ABC8KQE9_ERUVS|nr:unnamed protein product [Eruca vesicaria subsp. sativa]